MTSSSLNSQPAPRKAGGGDSTAWRHSDRAHSAEYDAVVAPSDTANRLRFRCRNDVLALVYHLPLLRRHESTSPDPVIACGSAVLDSFREKTPRELKTSLSPLSAQPRSIFRQVPGATKSPEYSPPTHQRGSPSCPNSSHTAAPSGIPPLARNTRTGVAANQNIVRNARSSPEIASHFQSSSHPLDIRATPESSTRDVDHSGRCASPRPLRCPPAQRRQSRIQTRTSRSASRRRIPVLLSLSPSQPQSLTRHPTHSTRPLRNLSPVSSHHNVHTREIPFRPPGEVFEGSPQQIPHPRHASRRRGAPTCPSFDNQGHNGDNRRFARETHRQPNRPGSWPCPARESLRHAICRS